MRSPPWVLPEMLCADTFRIGADGTVRGERWLRLARGDTDAQSSPGRPVMILARTTPNPNVVFPPS